MTRTDRSDSHTRERVRDLHGQGLGRNAIARETGIPAVTVSAIAHDLGLTFERGVRVRQATAARQADNASRRASILGRLYAEAEAKLVELESVRSGRAKWSTIMRGEFGVEDVRRTDFVPARDFNQVGQTIGFFAAHAAKLEAVDNPEGKAAASLLTSLADAVGIHDDPDTQPAPAR